VNDDVGEVDDDPAALGPTFASQFLGTGLFQGFFKVFS